MSNAENNERTKYWYEIFYSDQDFFKFVGFKDDATTRKEVNFILKALDLPEHSKILDLCCGYGRHSIELAKRGYHVVGLDLSERYLQLGKKRAKEENVDVTFVQGDMRELPWIGEFDGVINMFTSFGFFEGDKENLKVLENVSKALKERGIFLLDVENKYYFILNDVLRKGKDWIEYDDGSIALISNNYDVLREREIMKVKIIKGNIVKESGYSIRLYSYPELVVMLRKVNLEPYAVYGDYDFTPLRLTSKRLIILSRKVHDKRNIE